MSSRNCALLDRTDIIGRSGFRGAYWWAISKRSADLGVAPKEVTAAVALMRSGRTDLITEVMNKRLTVRAALAAVRAFRLRATKATAAETRWS